MCFGVSFVYFVYCVLEVVWEVWVWGWSSVDVDGCVDGIVFVFVFVYLENYCCCSCCVYVVYECYVHVYFCVY